MERIRALMTYFEFPSNLMKTILIFMIWSKSTPRSAAVCEYIGDLRRLVLRIKRRDSPGRYSLLGHFRQFHRALERQRRISGRRATEREFRCPRRAQEEALRYDGLQRRWSILNTQKIN